MAVAHLPPNKLSLEHPRPLTGISGATSNVLEITAKSQTTQGNRDGSLMDN